MAALVSKIWRVPPLRLLRSSQKQTVSNVLFRNASSGSDPPEPPIKPPGLLRL